MGDADAVREREVLEDRLRHAALGIVANQAAVAPALETVERPVRELVARRRLAEIDLAVGGDVEIVGEIEPRIVLEPRARARRTVRHLENRAIRLYAVNAHAGDTDEQVLVAIEGEPEGAAADARKVFADAIVGGEKADDRAVAVDGVEIVPAIQDYVLGSLDLVERDRLGVLQPIVLGKDSAPVASDRRRRLEIHPARHDIDFLKHLALVLYPLDIEADGDKQNDPDNRRRQIAGEAGLDQAAYQHENNCGAHHRAGDCAASPGETDSAEHHGGERVDLPADARVGARTVLAGRVKDPGERGYRARDHIGGEQRTLHVDAGVTGGLPTGADGHDVHTRTHAGQIEVRRDCDHDKDGHVGRNAENESRPHEIPDRRIAVDAGE